MRAVEIGRRMAQTGHQPEAVQAYTLALSKERKTLSPEERMEASVFLFQNGEDYKPAYDGFLDLYREGFFRDEIFPILTEAFYLPNVKMAQKRYEKNCKRLKRYPYLFRKDFVPFDDLPILFFPYDDDTYIPLDTRTGEFLPKFAPRFEVISRNFFHDLSRPVLASDVFSQYELEYLNDNVRRSEDVCMENHLYLHYTDWSIFCAYLQVLDPQPLIKAEKSVFLIEDERALYPIDFQERFGIDYSQYDFHPPRIREVTKLIWHTQLSAHNGGDFFNEIFDFHPNLLVIPSVMMNKIKEEVNTLREALETVPSLKDLQEQILDHWNNPGLVAQLYYMKKPTDKDILVAIYMGANEWSPNLDLHARITPALFFQPHFHRISSLLAIDPEGNVEINSPVMDGIRKSTLFTDFPYIKTFTPMRRFTTSCAGAHRFYILLVRDRIAKAREGDASEFYNDRTPDLSLYENWEEQEDKVKIVRGDPQFINISDIVTLWATSRSYLADPEDRLFRDSVVVRFEDGKLNPKATFTRLAAFLDLPYTETMTYCSEKGVHDPTANYAVGFDTSSVYATHDEYMDDGTRRYVEFCMRDAYKTYGYDFQFYDGGPVDMDTVETWIREAETVRGILRESQKLYYQAFRTFLGFDPLSEEERKQLIDTVVEECEKERRRAAMGLMDVEDLRFVSDSGTPLLPGRLLEPDPDLMVQPLYH